MADFGIPANAHNGVVAGENAIEMKKLVKSFNEMIKEQVSDEFDTAVITLMDIVEEEGKEDKSSDFFSISFDLVSDYEEEWRKYACEHGKVEPSVAIEFYRQNGDMFINDGVMGEFIQELADEYSVDDAVFLTQECKIYMDNPCYDDGQ